ncbi:energy-coupling factor transporter transmembrane component T family protein [Bacillus vallismortis]|uniref:energy-coupling factor transporter transmembrane component T family protein n=1 Tax=Bacillus vallismortis TaxID=72361 RepID=UPI002091616A|nr:energy-coupling factor transporter transmembrane component T [Bacillus vallismortis]MCO4852512.1 energy-coupling factor transporter transmembrane protein EcfT [Bacillus vallismortis]
MARNVIIGQYIQRSSFFHRLDPRTKILSIFMFAITILLTEDLMSYLAATCIVVLCVCLTNIPIRVFINILKPILVILLFTLFFHLLFSKGEHVLLSVGMVNITMEGIKEGIKVVYRIILMVIIASLLTLTTKPLDITYGLERLFKPLSIFKVPVEQFSLMISITLRFIPTIVEEADKIMEAQRARGAQMNNKGLIEKFSSYIPIIIPLLVSSVQRAERLSLAIDARGYGNGKDRTKYRQLIFRKNDYGTLITSISFFLFLLVLKVF